MSAPLRILHVITRLDLGGSAENTLHTCIGLDKSRYAVDLVCGCSDNPASPREVTAAASGVRIMRMRTLVREISPVNDLLALVRLYGLMRRNRYRLVHTHTSKPGIVGRIAARAAGAPLIVHTPHGHVFYGYFSPAKTRFFAGLERIATSWTDAMVTLTQQEKDDYLARRIGRAERIHPILSGIDLAPYLDARADRSAVRATLGLADTDVVVVTVARLVDIKNHDLIVSAAGLCAGSIPGLRFLFVGDGDRRKVLQSRIESLGLSDRFIFSGWRDDIPALLASSDIFVLCSTNEGMGRAFVEAQAVGLPVIGSRVCGIPEVLRDGETGFLVPPDDPAVLADRITRLCSDPGLRNRMGAQGRAWVSPRFGRDRMVEHIDALYQRLLAEKPA